MSVIWKYILASWDDSISGSKMLSLPAEAQILSVQAQDNNIVLWAKTDPNQTKMEEHIFKVFTTGPAFDFNGEVVEFLATVQMSNGLVFHVFHKKSYGG